MEYSSFKCPACNEFISTKQEACRFCGIQLTDEIKISAVEGQKSENRQERFRDHVKHLAIGSLVFLVGAGATAASLFKSSQTGGSAFLFYGLVIFGFLEIGYGLFGLIDDVYDKRRNL